MRRRGHYNDTERRLWVLNDEGLYTWHRESHQSMRDFIRENRETIDSVIAGTISIPVRKTK